MKGRYIGKNARLILNIADYCNIEIKDGIVLLLGILHLWKKWILYTSYVIMKDPKINVHKPEYLLLGRLKKYLYRKKIYKRWNICKTLLS